MCLHKQLIRLFPLLLAASAAAQISPGDLSRYHQHLEGLANCTACHELRREVADANCLACHRALRARIQAQRGFHSHSSVAGKNCRECHSEHNGRDFELVHWPAGQSAFDHSRTGFELSGAHAKLDCRRCHAAERIADQNLAADSVVNQRRTFLGLDAACIACHVDEHRDQLTDDCLACHDAAAWSPAPRFNHSRTRYPLTGRHEQTACVKCHPLQPTPAAISAARIDKRNNTGYYAHYSELQYGSCAACHTDTHQGRFGSDCASCHTTAGFALQGAPPAPFDHARTGFPLTGKHAAVTCLRCHTSGSMTQPLAHDRCADCHRDVHRGQFADRAAGGACEECHTVDGFQPARFSPEQHQTTRYPLTGSHLAIPCVACHKSAAGEGESIAQFTYPDLRCAACHADAHRGQLDHWIKDKGCEFCHNTDTWHRTSFDHGLARFPLEGKHREILCLKCHTVVHAETGDSTLWMKPLEMTCAGCHPDAHRGQFLRPEPAESEPACARCHTPAGWSTLTFDHARDSRFALDGAHARLACAQCHIPETENEITFVRYRPLGTACADCHAAGK